MNRILILFLLICLFSNSAGQTIFKEKAIVTANSLNIREKPTPNSKIVGKLKKDETILIENSFNGYAGIKLENNFKGYVSMKYLDKTQYRYPNSFADLMLRIQLGRYFSSLIGIILVFWLLTFLGNRITWLLSSFKYKDISGFSFSSSLGKGMGYQKLANFALGKSKQHPYSTYWLRITFIYILMTPVFIFIYKAASITTGLSHMEILNSLWFKFACLTMGITPFIIFLFKSATVIRKTRCRREWFSVFFSLVFSIPIILLVVSISIFALSLSLLLIMLMILQAMSLNKKAQKMVIDINSPGNGRH